MAEEMDLREMLLNNIKLCPTCKWFVRATNTPCQDCQEKGFIVDIDQALTDIQSHYKARRLSEEEIKGIIAQAPFIRHETYHYLAHAIFKAQELLNEKRAVTNIS